MYFSMMDRTGLSTRGAASLIIWYMKSSAVSSFVPFTGKSLVPFIPTRSPGPRVRYRSLPSGPLAKAGCSWYIIPRLTFIS